MGLPLWISLDPETAQPQTAASQNLSACHFYPASKAANKHGTPTGTREMPKDC